MGFINFNCAVNIKKQVISALRFRNSGIPKSAKSSVNHYV